jgi:carbamoyl-phosphate synthase small subunit
VVIDCGIKRNIMRALAARGCKVTALPYGATAAQTLALKPAGVLFGNGPGDPEPCGKAQELARALLQKRVPLFGLCLGHQIICAALGGKTQKMKFGHHGANHPAVAANGRVLITSQNHGFVVDAKTLPANCRVTHSSLFDGSLQGVASDNPPCITFQGHPEASPGPHDAGVLFDDFVCLMRRARKARGA